MSAFQSNFAATSHRRVGWWPVRESCETSPLEVVAWRVPLQSPSETNWSFASSQRLKATPFIIEGATVRWIRPLEFGLAFTKIGPGVEQLIRQLCRSFL